MSRIYVSNNGVTRTPLKMYMGVNDVAKEVQKVYIGVNGKAVLIYPAITDSYLSSVNVDATAQSFSLNRVEV